LDFARVLERIANFLRSERYPVAVIGALGLHAYGLTRATSDLDFVTGSAAQAKLIPFMESLGYKTLHVSSGYSNHAHSDPLMGRVDFVYVSGETERVLFEGATTELRFQGISVPVPRPEHLAAMKIHAMKNDPERVLQELADIQFLLRLPGIDQEEIRGYFEKSGLLEKYDELKKTL
jgi:hypothetical protein